MSDRGASQPHINLVNWLGIESAEVFGSSMNTQHTDYFDESLSRMAEIEKSRKVALVGNLYSFVVSTVALAGIYTLFFEMVPYAADPYSSFGGKGLNTLVFIIGLGGGLIAQVRYFDKIRNKVLAKDDLKEIETMLENGEIETLPKKYFKFRKIIIKNNRLISFKKLPFLSSALWSDDTRTKCVDLLTD